LNPQNGESCLGAAALFGHLAIVKQLVAAGADITLKNQDGLTPLQIARQQKYINVVDYLLEKEHQVSLLCKTPTSTTSKITN
jgi:ankyrin repeat protein